VPPLSPASSRCVAYRDCIPSADTLHLEAESPRRGQLLPRSSDNYSGTIRQRPSVGSVAWRWPGFTSPSAGLGWETGDREQWRARAGDERPDRDDHPTSDVVATAFIYRRGGCVHIGPRRSDMRVSACYRRHFSSPVAGLCCACLRPRVVGLLDYHGEIIGRNMRPGGGSKWSQREDSGSSMCACWIRRLGNDSRPHASVPSHKASVSRRGQLRLCGSRRQGRWLAAAPIR